MAQRLIKISLIFFGSLMLVAFSLVFSVRPGPGGTVAALLTTPTVIPEDTVSVEVQLVPSTTLVTVGEVLTELVYIEDNSTGNCQFSAYDLTLIQEGVDAPIFEYLSPAVVGPPVPGNPVTFTLLATKTGTINLLASVFGESYCNGSWYWTSAGGRSEAISVALGKEKIYLPILRK